jgi:hypothetical protein
MPWPWRRLGQAEHLCWRFPDPACAAAAAMASLIIGLLDWTGFGNGGHRSAGRWSSGRVAQ